VSSLAQKQVDALQQFADRLEIGALETQIGRLVVLAPSEVAANLLADLAHLPSRFCSLIVRRGEQRKLIVDAGS
jgi:hypothetical protein